MTIGSITPASTLLVQRAARAPDASAGELFTKVLDAELRAMGDQMSPTDGAAATRRRDAGATTTPPRATAAAQGAMPATAPAHHAAQGFTVSYVRGATPVSTGTTPAPLVRNATGELVLTARTTGLTQLTTHFTGTVADPTAAARATASVMAQIARLVANGQA